DAELDAREAAQASAGAAPAGAVGPAAGSGPDAGAAEGPADAGRPWWESDPRFSDRFRQV
ncbi:MAG TPA: hypothetical protein VE733_04485, partial [Streptosporangiaceae bacterium]|nr:hypothetical protein [Streptosporangiaceae bacterium]